MQSKARHRRHRSKLAGLLIAVALLLGPSAHAQTPLRQRPRFPIRISKPGSYQLVENLEVKTGDAIEVLSDRVSIDLNGFSIVGPGGTSQNGDSGIDASGRSFVSVSHGSIVNFTGNGITLGDNGVVKSVHADGNGALGIFCKTNCSVSDSTANNNGFQGIVAGASSAITGNIVNGNQTGVGITVARDSSVSGNTTNANAGGGILGGTIALPCHCRIVNNTANDNLSFGILAGDFAVLTQNVADGNSTFGICGGRSSTINGNTAGSNASEGIIAHAGSVVLGNSSVDNGANGLIFPQDNGTSSYGQNALLNNHTGDTNGGSSLGQSDTNLCSGQKC